MRRTFSGDYVAHAKRNALRFLMSTPMIMFCPISRIHAWSILDQQSLD